MANIMGSMAPRAGKGGTAISLCATTGVHTLYLGSDTIMDLVLQSGPSSPSVQEAIHLRTIFRDCFNGFMWAAKSLVHNREDWHDLSYWELKLFLQCKKTQTELLYTGQTEPLLHCEYWTATLIYTSKGQNLYFLFSTEPICCNI